MKLFLSRGKIVMLAAVAPFLSAATAAPIPLFEADFNETNPAGIWFGGGSTSGVAAGVSGRPGDYAFNNSGPGGMGTNAPNSDHRAIIQNSAGLFTGLQSFTVSGWYKADTAPGFSARLMEAGNVNILFRDNSGTNPSNLSISINGTTVNSEVSSTLLTTDWTFFAVTFDGSFVHVYAGNVAENVVLVGSPIPLSLPNGVISSAGAINPVLANTNTSGARRPFDGLIDNFRIYGSNTDGSGALSLADLQSLRAGDLAPIPEPSSFALAAGVLCVGAAFVLRRRRATRGA